MAKEQIEYTRHMDLAIRQLTSHGLLVGAYDSDGKANAMTIGWGSVGSIWGIPVWIVLVRPSRYTYQCIEHTGCFTVNVPTPKMTMACATCGSKSGRDVDKFAECPLVYECQVVHSNDVLPQKLADEILAGAYQDGDFHRVYYGKILSALAEPDAAKLLA